MGRIPGPPYFVCERSVALFNRIEAILLPTWAVTVSRCKKRIPEMHSYLFPHPSHGVMYPLRTQPSRPDTSARA